MHGIAERIEDGADLVVDLFRQMDGVEGRDLEIVGKGAGDVDADALGFGIEMEVPGPHHAAFHADQVALARDAVADLHGAHMGADFGHDASKFMADHHGHGDGLLRPLVPFPDVQVSAANAGLGDLDQDIVRADLRHRLVAHAPDLRPVPPSPMRASTNSPLVTGAYYTYSAASLRGSTW